MPTISSFYGIVIRMFFFGGEHNPPHFHAYYAGFEAAIDIRTLEVIDGHLPTRAERLVKEWAAQYRGQLLEMWESQRFAKLPPLE